MIILRFKLHRLIKILNDLFNQFLIRNLTK